MTLYNCKSSDDGYIITKFDDDMNVESSYHTTLSECECPAGSRPSCRHRLMLPKFIQAKAIDTGSFYDYENQRFDQLEVEDMGDEDTDEDWDQDDERFRP